MSDLGNKLIPPEKFLFPFEPYSIQIEFMKSLYEAIEENKIGIFESPTGTGKSLSLICGTLTWLRDHEEREKCRIEGIISTNNHKDENVATSSLGDSGEPSWVEEFAKKQLIDAGVRKAQKEKEKQNRRNDQLNRIRSRKSTISDTKRSKYVKRKREPDCDETILLMQQAKKEIENYEANKPVDEDVQFALDEYTSEDEKEKEEDEKEDDGVTRVFFCSRTHSQLSQFVHELQKSPFGNRLLEEEGFLVSVATLASRNSLCINDSVRKLPSIHQMNEKCLEMQKNSKEKKSKLDDNSEAKKRKRSSMSKATCCYYSNNDGMTQLTETIAGKILDVEELVKEGKEVQACPYYSARHALPYSHLVVLPYQTLLHRPTRIASGINIKGSVVIIDEAHNLVDAINGMYSSQITTKQLAKALNQLSQYSKKFNTRLKAKNLFYVKQLIYVLRSLISVVACKSNDSTSVKGHSKSEGQTSLLNVNDFLFKASLDNINFFKLLRYCSKSKISLKLSGFVEKYEVELQRPKNKSSLSNFLQEIKNPVATEVVQTSVNCDVTMRSPLMHIESFLMSLTSASKDGRVALTTGNESSLKFLLLNPANHFEEILDDCRALIVAGGTMQPSSCMIDQLITPAKQTDHRSRIIEFSCGHVIDGAKQLLPIALSSGPSGEIFQFTYEKRTSDKLINELGRVLININNITPGGVVCFFPSYDYENVVFEKWKNEGIISKLEVKKKVFREPKKTSQVEQVLGEYTKCIERSKMAGGRSNGGLLFSVVGGKMSEGINFSDDLGRCIVMIGLPYPNMYSPELKEKMNYLDKNMPRHSDGRSAGQIHYENLCMKAVNQSIGRAIRHRNDYACLLLLDQRYSRASVYKKLPDWIGKHLRKVDQFGHAFAAIKKFFGDKKL